MKTLTSLIVLLVLLVNTSAQAASKQEIDVYVEETLNEFRQHSPAGAKLAARSRGMLVFPKYIRLASALAANTARVRCA